MIKNFVEVPASKEQDINQEVTSWLGDKYIAIDEGNFETVYIGHYTEDATDETGSVKEATRAFPIRVEKPVSRAALINSAEMGAYNLVSSMDVASFNASLARKSRENENSEEVKEHDDFIAWVKDELTKIGL